MLPSVNNLLDFFLPSFCSHCRTKLKTDEEHICAECLQRINVADNERKESEFGRKFGDNKIISEFITHFIFEKDRGLQSLIHSLKYNNKFRIGIYLGKILAESNSEFFTSRKIDLIVPVPLHQLKKAERGYNQAHYIAKGISRFSGIPHSENILKRKKFTRTQTKLSLSEREENVKNAFKKRRHANVEGKNIFLIDDVITTGATINECGKTLLKSGANKVFAGSVALAD
ncbi:MAG: ComF family protein [Ignavibacteriaceae bacterium]